MVITDALILVHGSSRLAYVCEFKANLVNRMNFKAMNQYDLINPDTGPTWQESE